MDFIVEFAGDDYPSADYPSAVIPAEDYPQADYQSDGGNPMWWKWACRNRYHLQINCPNFIYTRHGICADCHVCVG